MDDNDTFFDKWCRAVDDRIRQINPGLQYALDSSGPRFQDGRVIRFVPDDLGSRISWTHQGRTVHVFAMDGHVARVTTFSAQGRNIPEFEIDVHSSTIEAMSTDIAAFLLHTRVIDRDGK